VRVADSVRRPAAGAEGPGVEGAAAEAPDAWVGLVDLLTADDEAILARLGRFYLHDRETRWLRRNALLVLGNVADGSEPDIEAVLRTYLADPDPMLRAHAVWAAARLSRQDLLPRSDHHPTVRAELDDLPMPRPST
jgi:hypothetical protein